MNLRLLFVLPLLTVLLNGCTVPPRLDAAAVVLPIGKEPSFTVTLIRETGAPTQVCLVPREGVVTLRAEVKGPALVIEWTSMQGGETVHEVSIPTEELVPGGRRVWNLAGDGTASESSK